MPHTTQKDGFFGFDTEKSSLIYEKKKYSCKFFLNCKKEKNSIGNNNKIISANNKNKSNLIIAVSKSHNSSSYGHFGKKSILLIKT